MPCHITSGRRAEALIAAPKIDGTAAKEKRRRFRIPIIVRVEGLSSVFRSQNSTQIRFRLRNPYTNNVKFWLQITYWPDFHQNPGRRSTQTREGKIDENKGEKLGREANHVRWRAPASPSTYTPFHLSSRPTCSPSFIHYHPSVPYNVGIHSWRRVFWPISRALMPLERYVNLH